MIELKKQIQSKKSKFLRQATLIRPPIRFLCRLSYIETSYRNKKYCKGSVDFSR